MEKEMRNDMALAIEEKALADDQFLKDLITARTSQDTQQVLSKYGFAVSMEEVNAFIEKGKSLLQNEAKVDTELSEDDLEAVAGGGKWRGRLRYAGALLGGAVLGAGYGALCGICPAAAAATPYVVGGYAALATYWVMDGYAK